MNVFLRMAEADDFGEYYRIRCSPADIYWNGYTDKPDKESFRKLYMERIASAPFCKKEDRRIYLIEVEDKMGIKIVVGFVQFILHDESIEIGYSVIEEYQRCGIATKALGLAIEIAKSFYQRIFVSIRDDNIASQRTAMKNGFLRSSEYIENQYPYVGVMKLRRYYLF